MQIQYTARHMDLTDPLKEYVSSKIDKMKKYLNSIVDAQVTLSVEKYRHKAEITLRGKKETYAGTEISGDMYLSIDNVFDKIEKQIVKKKDKKVAKRASRSAADNQLPVIDRSDRIEDAIDATEIVRQELSNTIVETEEIHPKPMSIEEALMQFALNRENCLVFENQNSSREIQILYRRMDGKLGLIRTK